MSKLSFTIAGEPKGKARPRMNTRTHRTYTPNATIQYENLVKTCFMAKYPEWVPSESPIRAVITAYYPIPKSYSKAKLNDIKEGKLFPMRTPDLDNIAKSVLDSLNTIAYRDDKQVVELIMNKLYGEIPRVKVTLEEIEEV